MHDRNPSPIKTTMVLLAMMFFLLVALSQSGSALPLAVAGALEVPGMASTLPPTVVGKDEDGYTTWTVDWSSVSWCSPVSTLAYPFNLMGQDPTELSDASLELIFNEGTFKYVDDGSGGYLPYWEDPSWGVALNGRPPNDWQLVGAIGAVPSESDVLSVSDPIPVDSSRLIDGINYVTLQQHDLCPQEPGCRTCACTCINVKQVQLRAMLNLQLKSFSPQDGSQNIPIKQEKYHEDITVNFTLNPDEHSVSQETFQVWYYDASLNPVYVPGQIRKVSPQSFAFLPNAPLIDGIQYHAQIWGKEAAEAEGRDKWVRTTGGDPLLEGKIWSFSTSPNIQVKVVPVQVVEGATLIANKSTALKVYLRWEKKDDVFAPDQVDAVELDDIAITWAISEGQQEKARWSQNDGWLPQRTPETALRKREYLTFNDASDSYDKFEKLASQDSVIYRGFLPQQAGNYNFTADVTLKSTSGKVQHFGGLATVSAAIGRPFHVNWVAAAVGSDYGSTGTIDKKASVQDSLLAMKSIFPLTSIIRTFNPTLMPWYRPYRNSYPVGLEFVRINWQQSPPDEMAKVILLQEMSRLCSNSTDCDVTLGFAPANWLGACGLTEPDIARKGALTQPDTTGPYRFVMAHEIGHLLNHEHDTLQGGEGYDVLGVNGKDRRSSVAQLPPRDGNITVQIINNFMNVDPVESPPAERLWIAPAVFEDLRSRLIPASQQANAAWVTSPGADQLLQAAGVIKESTGEVGLWPWYVLDPRPWSAPAAGLYKIIFLDDLGQEISSYTHSFSATQTGNSSDPAVFMFDVPFPAVTARIQLRRVSDDALLKEITPNASAPGLVIDTPAGATWSGPQTVSWHSSGSGDHFSILSLSTDNGATWQALGIDIITPTLTIETAAFPNTTQAKIRVQMSDGLRTTTAVQGPFTIANPIIAFPVSPGDGTTDVGVDAEIVAGFRDAMDAATINAETITITGGPFGIVSGRVSYDPEERQASFHPTIPLSYNTTYSVQLSTAIKDTNGQSLASPVNWSFTTQKNFLPPKPRALFPANGSRGASFSGAVMVAWNADLNPASITEASFVLSTAAGSPVAGAVTYDTASRSAFLTPAANLSPNTIYIASLKAGIQDVDGNATQGNIDWAFTTGKDVINPFGFINTFIDDGLDINGDGLYEQLAIRAGVQITTSGTYTLNATLADAAGAEITWTSASASLEPGERFLDLVFDGGAIGGHGVDGPYTLAKLLIVGADGASAAYQGIYRTFAYAAGQFPAPLRFTGLPDAWVLPGQALTPDVNVRSYAQHVTQGSDQLKYTLITNTDLRAGVTLESDGSIKANPRTGWRGVTDVTVQAAYGDDQAQDSFRVTVGAPIQIFIPMLPKQNTGSTSTQSRSNWQGGFFDDFETSFGWTTWSSISGPPGGWYVWDRRDCLAYSGQYSAWLMGGGDDGKNTPCGAAYPNTLVTTMVRKPAINLKYTSKADFSIKVWTDLAEGDQICAMVTNENIDDSSFLPDIHFYGVCRSGQTNGWEDLTLDLSQAPTLGNLLGTENVWVAVRFTADGSGSRPAGVYVDDARVRLCPQGLTCNP